MSLTPNFMGFFVFFIRNVMQLLNQWRNLLGSDSCGQMSNLSSEERFFSHQILQLQGEENIFIGSITRMKTFISLIRNNIPVNCLIYQYFMNILFEISKLHILMLFYLLYKSLRRTLSRFGPFANQVFVSNNYCQIYTYTLHT